MTDLDSLHKNQQHLGWGYFAWWTFGLHPTSHLQLALCQLKFYFTAIEEKNAERGKKPRKFGRCVPQWKQHHQWCSEKAEQRDAWFCVSATIPVHISPTPHFMHMYLSMDDFPIPAGAWTVMMVGRAGAASGIDQHRPNISSIFTLSTAPAGNRTTEF